MEIGTYVNTVIYADLHLLERERPCLISKVVYQPCAESSIVMARPSAHPLPYHPIDIQIPCV